MFGHTDNVVVCRNWNGFCKNNYSCQCFPYHYISGRPTLPMAFPAPLEVKVIYFLFRSNLQFLLKQTKEPYVVSCTTACQFCLYYMALRLQITVCLIAMMSFHTDTLCCIGVTPDITEDARVHQYIMHRLQQPHLQYIMLHVEKSLKCSHNCVTMDFFIWIVCRAI